MNSVQQYTIQTEIVTSVPADEADDFIGVHGINDLRLAQLTNCGSASHFLV